MRTFWPSVLRIVISPSQGNPLFQRWQRRNWGISRERFYLQMNKWVNPLPRPPEKPEPYSGDSRPIWGLRKQHHQTQPTKERILQNMHSMIQRRRISKGNCLWKNTPTRPAWGCLWPSKKTWPPSVTVIRSMSQTSWDVPSLNSSPTSNETQIRIHVICSSEVMLGYPSDITPDKTL